MARYFCLENPDTLTLAATVLDARPGAVRLDRHPFYPGGGGQLCDRGKIAWSGGEVVLAGIETVDGAPWLRLADPVLVEGTVEVAADPAFRQMMRALHTDLHIVNAIVYAAYDGALVTGAQMNEDGTARVDFDLQDADNDRLRALEGDINDIIAQDLPIRERYVTAEAARAEPGLIRSLSVAPPPTEDGMIRLVEIGGLDRQACGGTHLASTGGSPPVRILKVESKGRRNRRIRIGFA